MIVPARWLLLTGLSALTVGALFACTAGDDLAYQSSALTPDTGIVPVPVAESGIETRPPANDGGTLPAPTMSACPLLDPDGGCDPQAGLGCCLPSTGGSNVCTEQAQYYAGKMCGAPGDVFVSCLASNADSTCCWQGGPNGTVGTRYRVSCTADAGGPNVEACDPNANPDAGSPCTTTGGTCNIVSCRGIMVGYCGNGPSPCQ